MTTTWMRSAFCGAALSLALATPPAHAGGIPVIDVAGIAQMVTEYSEMLNQSGMMNAQISNQIDQIQQGLAMIEQGSDRFTQLGTQITQLQTQIEAMTGGRNLSGILDGLDGIRDLLPTDIAGGDTTAASIRLDELMVLDGLADGTALWGEGVEPTSRLAVAYVEAREKTYIEAASAETLIETMPEIETAYGTLIAEIDNTADVKASIDLAARIAAENGRAIARLTHLMAISAQARSAEERLRYAEAESSGAYTASSYETMSRAMIREAQ